MVAWTIFVAVQALAVGFWAGIVFCERNERKGREEMERSQAAE